MLNYPYSRYDTLTLAAFDLTTAVLALWLRVNLANDALRARPLAALSGFLFTLTVSRVIVGIALAPRFQESPGAPPNPVYGNNLAQQITSTFDVVLCGLAACILAAVIVAARIRRPRRRVRRVRRPVQPGAGATPPGGPLPPSEATTTRFGVAGDDHDAPTAVLSGGARSPRIFRSGESTRQERPKIFRPPGSPS
jgi:hypothetical protein